jgi:hypothetical protein
MKYISVMILLTASAALAAKETATGLVRVETVPSGSAIYCDGTAYGTSPAAITGLPEGNHLLVAEKEGYQTHRRTLSTLDGEQSTVTITMDPQTALAVIHTEPAGADVTIDGMARGKSPLLITDLPLGKHRVKLEVNGFQPKEVELNAVDRTPLKLSVSLSSDSASLNINSRPSGAEVLLNGISKGVTPISVDRIPAGNVTLEIRSEGCNPYKQMLTLAAGQSENITAVLDELPSTLEVNSIPDGARIYVDNEFRGTTPLKINDLQPATYRVRAELRGYSLTPARDVTLKRAETVREEFRLTKNAGSLQITTEPAGVKVFVDGEELGTTVAKADESDTASDALTIDLLGIGNHKVQLTRTGYFPLEFEITVEQNATVSSHQRLRRMFIKNYTVRTRDATYEGMLLGKTLAGGVRLEIRPGIVKTLNASDIVSEAPIMQDGAEGNKE